MNEFEMIRVKKSIFKSIWFYIGVLLALGLIYQHWRISGIESKWINTIKQEVEVRIKKSDEDRKNFEKLYKNDKQNILNELEKLRKSKKEIEQKLSDSEKKVNELSKEKLTRDDIDRHLNELFPNRSGVGTGK